MPKRDIAPAGAPCWIDLMTSDPDRSRAFYGELFGWTSEEAGAEYGSYFNFSRSGVLVAGGMSSAEDPGMPDVWSVYLAGEDAKATVDAAVALGGQVVVAPMPVSELGTMAFLTDVGHAGIGVWQPGTHKGFGVLGEPGAPAWFELHTRDYDASVGFYREVFGLEPKVEGDTPDFRYTTLNRDGEQQAGIMDASGFVPDGVPASWSIYFNVADTDASLAKVVDLGGSVVQPPDDTPYGRLAEAADPLGARFRLIAR